MIDIHTHLLYGVDDGPKSMEESVEMLRSAKAQGIHAIILTPHYRHGMFAYPNEKIEKHFLKLDKYAKEIGIDLYLGTEYHVNSMIIEQLRSGRCRTMADTQYVLAEYKPETDFSYIRRSAQDMLAHGYIPIVAHVERYECMYETLDHADWLKDMGAMIQVNADAVLGLEGGKTKRFVKKLLKNGYVDYVASDSHGMKQRTNNMGKCRDYLYKKYDKRYVDLILEKNAKKILQSEQM